MEMTIFGNNQFQKNKVYYRRKSLRLTNIALTLASVVLLGATAYFVSNRNEPTQEGVD